MTDASRLEASFDEAMHKIYRRAKSEAQYPAWMFLQMLHRDRGLSTAKKFINAAKESDGYAELYLRKGPDLTVEALVVENPRWHPLFLPEEIAGARQRLRKYGYVPRAAQKAGLTPPPPRPSPGD